MLELALDLTLDNGECFDNTVSISDSSIVDIEYEILNFIEDYFNEGYSECDPCYYSLSDVDYNHLLLGRKVTLNGLLKVQFSAEEH